MNDSILRNAALITPSGTQKTNLLIREGIIEITNQVPSNVKSYDLAGKYILPGFVDNHFHGYNLFSLTGGQMDPQTHTFDDSDEAYVRGFDMLRKTLAPFGVTGFYMGTSACSVETLRQGYRKMRLYYEKHNDPKIGSRMLGSLNEGTFINPDMAGAQNPEFILPISKDTFDSFDDQGCIKLINVVPDNGADAIKLTEYLSKKGIVVGAGHTNATYNQFAEAVKAGLKFCIHFTNGPTGGSYKPFDGGGAVEAVLSLDSVYAELIPDGYHVNPAYILDIIRRKGVDKIIAITDCVFVGGSDIKEFDEDGVKACVSENGEYVKLVGGAKNTLAGSNLTANRGFNNMLNWLTREMKGVWTPVHSPLSLDLALLDLSRFFSTNPNRLMGRDREGFGTLENGKIADLAVLDIQGIPGNYKVDVDKTFVGGIMVHSKN